jgi:hypothetical protein
MNQIVLIITLIISIISLLLQFENWKLKKLDIENKSLKINLLKALKAIQGYQDFIQEVSVEQGKTAQNLKGEIHIKYKESFVSKRFVEPSNIQELINKIE